jgi:4-amino-4-deoxy-L-arabinose transferase-like glycosyltransferase
MLFDCPAPAGHASVVDSQGRAHFCSELNISRHLTRLKLNEHQAWLGLNSLMTLSYAYWNTRVRRIPHSIPCAKARAVQTRRRFRRGLVRGDPPSLKSLAVCALVFAMIWLALLSYTSLTPPADNIEQLTWLNSLEWGYYKHPPLPTWIIWLPAMLFGVQAGTSYAVGAVVTLGSVCLLWRLLCGLHGRQYAAVACAAVLCITYYNGRLYYYNHDVVLMLLATASALFCWRASSTGLLRWWVALGVSLGLGALTKYQVVVTGTCVIVFWVWQRGWRDQGQRTGLLLCILIAFLIFAPHVEWLRTHEFAPVAYSLDTVAAPIVGNGRRWESAVAWIADQLFNRALPAWLLLMSVGCLRARIPFVKLGRASSSPKTVDSSKVFLLIWGLIPLAFVSVMSIMLGTQLQSHWGASFLLFVVPAGMELMAPRRWWGQVPARALIIAFVTIQAILLLVNYLTSPRGPVSLRDTHWRAFDSTTLAQRLEGPIHQATAGERICIISGPPELAGALALRLPDHPLVLIDGRLDRSPWISAAQLATCNVLEVREKPEVPRPKLSPFLPSLTWCVRRGVPPGSRTTATDVCALTASAQQ